MKWNKQIANLFLITLLWFPTLLTWLNCGPVELRTRDSSSSVAPHCLIWTLWSLWEIKRCCSLLCAHLFQGFAYSWALSDFFYFYILNVIPLQRPYYEIRLRVGATSRFTSRIILHQTKGTNHSSSPPFFNVFHAVVPGPLLCANLQAGISPSCSEWTAHYSAPVHTALPSVSAAECGRVRRSCQDIFCMISPKWRSRLLPSTETFSLWWRRWRDIYCQQVLDWTGPLSPSGF